uniref:Uncharacterized protein n=1 Tax=Tetranychus urticae TaxID=32264 RepID=T1KX88_TETUR
MITSKANFRNALCFSLKALSTNVIDVIDSFTHVTCTCKHLTNHN